MARPLLKQLFGYRILQLGGSGNRSFVEDSSLYHKIRFSPRYRPDSGLPVANAEELPLATDSVDAVVLYHALDFAGDSHRLLREATRVLRPGGRMLIVGFNPYSSWGLWRLFRRRSGIPWGGRFIAPGRVADWLRLLDLQVDSIRYGLHFFPVRMKSLLGYARSWERIGQRINSPFGGALYHSLRQSGGAGDADHGEVAALARPHRRHRCDRGPERGIRADLSRQWRRTWICSPTAPAGAIREMAAGVCCCVTAATRRNCMAASGKRPIIEWS